MGEPVEMAKPAEAEFFATYGSWAGRDEADAAALLEDYAGDWWVAGGRALEALFPADPDEVPPGNYRLLALVDGVEVASVDLTVTPADAGGGTGGGGTDGAGGSDGAASGPDALSTTGAGNLSWVLLLALVLIALGVVVRTTRIRRAA